MDRWLTVLILSLFAVIVFTAPQATALDTDGLVGAWLLDEGKGDNELMDEGMSVALDVQPGGKLVTTWSQIKARKSR